MKRSGDDRSAFFLYRLVDNATNKARSNPKPLTQHLFFQTILQLRI